MSNFSERVDQLSSSQRMLLALKEARAKLEALESSKTEAIAEGGRSAPSRSSGKKYRLMFNPEDLTFTFLGEEGEPGNKGTSKRVSRDATEPGDR